VRLAAACEGRGNMDGQRYLVLWDKEMWREVGWELGQEPRAGRVDSLSRMRRGRYAVILDRQQR
jgi:hypothetical protein